MGDVISGVVVTPKSSDEIEVTREMIEAGTKVLRSSGLLPWSTSKHPDNFSWVIEDILRAALRRASARKL